MCLDLRKLERALHEQCGDPYGTASGAGRYGDDDLHGYGVLAALHPDDDREDGPVHPAVADLRGHIAGADAILICTPEYAGALPGSLKNLLEWTVGDGGTYRKPVAWINVSGPASPTGGADAHESLRKVLRYVHADIVRAGMYQRAAHTRRGRSRRNDRRCCGAGGSRSRCPRSPTRWRGELNRKSPAEPLPSGYWDVAVSAHLSSTNGYAEGVINKVKVKRRVPRIFGRRPPPKKSAALGIGDTEVAGWSAARRAMVAHEAARMRARSRASRGGAWTSRERAGPRAGLLPWCV